MDSIERCRGGEYRTYLVLLTLWSGNFSLENYGFCVVPWHSFFGQRNGVWGREKGYKRRVESS